MKTDYGITTESIVRYLPRQREFKSACKELGMTPPATFEANPNFFYGVLLGIIMQIHRDKRKQKRAALDTERSRNEQ